MAIVQPSLPCADAEYTADGKKHSEATKDCHEWAKEMSNPTHQIWYNENMGGY
jgi:hypothetical protein